MGKGNNRAADGGDQKDGEVGKAVDGGGQNDGEVGKAGDGRNQEAGKIGYYRVGDRVEDVEVGDGGNQDNQCATVEDAVDSNDGVTAIGDPTDGVLAEVLVHPFGPLSSQSHLPSGITAICSG